MSRKKIRLMSLLDYINGQRKGKGAHRLEKMSMQDPFLLEAMEGFDSVEDDHMARITSIQNKIRKKKTKNFPIWQSIAAIAVVVIIAIASSQLLLDKDNNHYAQAEIQIPIDLYLPEPVYYENIAIIAYKNSEFTKDISISISNYKVDKSEINGLQTDLHPTDQTAETPIDLFIPNNEKD